MRQEGAAAALPSAQHGTTTLARNGQPGQRAAPPARPRGQCHEQLFPNIDACVSRLRPPVLPGVAPQARTAREGGGEAAGDPYLSSLFMMPSPSPARIFSSTTTQMLSAWRRWTKSAPSRTC